jgi:hypothetical protein
VTSVLNKDYKEMLQILLDNEVKFLVVGAYAMGAHGYPRATGDIDVWVEPSESNSKAVYHSLIAFGAPVADIGETTFTEKGVIFQIGVAPRRIDIITQLSGLEFSAAYRRQETIDVEGLPLPFLCRSDLIKNKKATGREKDRLDADRMEHKAQ